ncbi:MAG: hypothetical protein M0T70_00980 [Geobacteraceae bacterium]|nr:hypothetical protein [Geobacteraceae bacterium]
MKKIRYGLMVAGLLLCLVHSAAAELSIGIGLPNVSIGINLPIFPDLVRVPGYPVYYAPRMDANYFFYDGMYWVYQDDNWYASSWYNGPWGIVGPEVVPLYILRIPVRYYRQPPVYFRGWQSNAPPRWGQHWGRGWEQQRRGWDRWNRRAAPAPAPLPVYQRRYAGDRYPRLEQQRALRNQQYHYQPRDKVVRQHFKQQAVHATPAPAQRGRQQEPANRGQRRPDMQRPEPRQQGPYSPPQQRGGERMQQHVPAQPVPQQRRPAVQEQGRQQPAPQQSPRPQPGAARPQQQAPRQQDRGAAQRGRGQEQGQKNDEDRGQGRNR